MSYWVAVVARNAAQHLPTTLDSLLRQTISPKRITVVDDGSTDETGRFLLRYKEHNSIITVLTLPNRGYDIRRVPSNINLAWNLNNETDLLAQYFMISGDDCSYPSSYAETLISRMGSSKRLVVASGLPTTGGALAREHAASGSGRMIKSRFWVDAGGCYPIKAGWETWLLYTAAMNRCETRLFRDLHYEHVRPRGTTHQFAYWGAAMGTLGYHPLYALGRISKNALIRSIGVEGSVNMLRGYVQSRLGSDDPFISPYDPHVKRFVRREQARRIQRITATLV